MKNYRKRALSNMGFDKKELQVKLPKCPPTPPPPPPRPRWSSYTRREIEKFWRKKRLEEEEHFLAAIKAAARLRASHFSVIHPISLLVLNFHLVLMHNNIYILD